MRTISKAYESIESRAISAERDARNRRLKLDAVLSAAILRAHASVNLAADGEVIYPFTAGYVNSGMPAEVPRVADNDELRELLEAALDQLSPLVDWRKQVTVWNPETSVERRKLTGRRVTPKPTEHYRRLTIDRRRS